MSQVFYKAVTPVVTKWDLRFMSMAKNEVATWSKDPRKQVGCVIVSPDRSRFSIGYNGFPRDIADSDERLENKPLKNSLMVHAEPNAIFNAGTSLVGWAMYVTAPPCLECAKAIIQARIATLVCPDLDQSSKWYESQLRASGYLNEAGVFLKNVEEEK